MRSRHLVVASIPFVWVAIYGHASAGQLVLGLVLGMWLVPRWAGGRLERRPGRLATRAVAVAQLLGEGAVEVVRANLTLARATLRPGDAVAPTFERMPLGGAAPLAQALFGEMVTLAPGEIVVDYDAADRSVLVHVIDRRVAIDHRGWWRILRRVGRAVG